jgi:hypothetical protein
VSVLPDSRVPIADSSVDLVDVYLMFANSALAANTFLRSLFGAGFPPFAFKWYVLLCLIAEHIMLTTSLLPQAWCALGHESSGISLHSDGANSFPFPQIWHPHPREVPLYAEVLSNASCDEGECTIRNLQLCLLATTNRRKDLRRYLIYSGVHHS